MNRDALRQSILDQVRKFATDQEAPRPFLAGQTAVPPAGRVLDAEAYVALVDAALDGWLTTGRFNEEFERLIAQHRVVTVPNRPMQMRLGTEAESAAHMPMPSTLYIQ